MLNAKPRFSDGIITPIRDQTLTKNKIIPTPKKILNTTRVLKLSVKEYENATTERINAPKIIDFLRPILPIKEEEIGRNKTAASEVVPIKTPISAGLFVILKKLTGRIGINMSIPEMENVVDKIAKIKFLFIEYA